MSPIIHSCPDCGGPCDLVIDGTTVETLGLRGPPRPLLEVRAHSLPCTLCRDCGARHPTMWPPEVSE